MHFLLFRLQWVEFRFHQHHPIHTLTYTENKQRSEFSYEAHRNAYSARILESHIHVVYKDTTCMSMCALTETWPLF